MTPDDLYEATRKWWLVNPGRDPDYAFSVFKGAVKAVYRIDGWEQPPPRERVGRLERRWAFRGVVSPEMEMQYIGADLTDYFPRGAANPVRYANC